MWSIRDGADRKFIEEDASIAAPSQPKDTTKTVSVDEMTGIQALERIAPSLPIKPGKVERREFEYVRHGMTFQLLTGMSLSVASIAFWAVRLAGIGSGR